MRKNNTLCPLDNAKPGSNGRATLPDSGRSRERMSSAWFATVSMFLSTVILMATSAFSAGPDDVLGPWETDGGDSRVELFRCGEAICGTIVWLKVPNYIDSNDGPVGETKSDRNNPEPELRNLPILGLQVIKGLTDKGVNQWVKGTCYDPESGKSYKCEMNMVSPHKLELRGYIGISLFGRTFNLTR